MNKEIEKIKFDEELIKETAVWWEKEVKARQKELEELLSKEDSTIEEIEAVQKQMALLYKKGGEEQKFIAKHEEAKELALRKYLISGCSNLDLDINR